MRIRVGMSIITSYLYMKALLKVSAGVCLIQGGDNT